MKKIITIFIYIFLSLQLHANTEASKRLIKEYYRYLEEDNVETAINMLTHNNTAINPTHSFYNIQSINVDFEEVKEKNKQSVIVYAKRNNGETFFHRATFEIYQYNGKTNLKNCRLGSLSNPYSREQLTVIDYYKFMQKPKTLINAYNMSPKKQSFETYKSWYSYTKAYVDLEFIHVDKSNVNLVVTFMEKNNESKSFFKYEVDMIVSNNRITSSSSRQVKYNPHDFYIDTNLDGRDYLKIQPSITEIETLLNDISQKRELTIHDFYNIYRRSDSQKNIIAVLSRYINKFNNSDGNLELIKSNFLNIKELLFKAKYSRPMRYELKPPYSGILRMCLEAGLDPSFEIKPSYSEPEGLHFMESLINCNDIKLFKFAVKKGGKIPKGSVFKAGSLGYLDMLDILIQNGGDINESGRVGHHVNSGLFCYAVSTRNYRLFDYLINKRASTEVIYHGYQDFDGISYEEEHNATSLAIKLGYFDMLEDLLEFGAEPPEGNKFLSSSFYDQIKNKDSKLESLIYSYKFIEAEETMKIYSIDNIFYFHHILLDPYTAAEQYQRMDFIEYLEKNDVRKNFVDNLMKYEM